MKAACLGAPTYLFFPDPEDADEDPLKLRDKEDPYNVRVLFCTPCPARAECELRGRHEEHGIWGGLTPTQRRNR